VIPSAAAGTSIDVALRGVSRFGPIDICDRSNIRWFGLAVNESLRMRIPGLKENGASCIAALFGAAEMHVLRRH
jgi:hypothetical protein